MDHALGLTGIAGSIVTEAGFGKNIRHLDQIVFGRNRLRRSADHVNLVYTIGIEQIHAPDRNRPAVPFNRDPLWSRSCFASRCSIGWPGTRT